MKSNSEGQEPMDDGLVPWVYDKHELMQNELITSPLTMTYLNQLRQFVEAEDEDKQGRADATPLSFEAAIERPIRVHQSASIRPTGCVWG